MGTGFGMDGGGTKTRLMVFDTTSGRSLYQAEGGPCNPHSVGMDTAKRNIQALLDGACQALSLTNSDYDCGCLGAAGLGRAAEQAAFTSWLQGLLPCPVQVCSDGEILLAGALSSPSGYALVSGTGSFALGRNSEGSLVRAGGLGHMLGDEGSASWLGWQAAQRALKSAEGRDLATALLPQIISALGLQDREQLVPWFHHQFDKKAVAACAPVVLKQAQQGDALACDLVEEAAFALLSLVHSVTTRLPLQGVHLALGGGLLETDTLLRRRLLELLKQAWPQAHVVFARPGDALQGACLLAARLVSAAND